MSTTHGIVDDRVLPLAEADRQELQARVANLEIALETNRRIGAAIGLVMADHRLDIDAAFGVLTTLSQERNIKLREVADRILADHRETIGAV